MQPYKCIPSLRAEFTKTHGFLPPTKLLVEIHQKKGEAEMAQVDWVEDLHTTLKNPSKSIVSVVSSGDIDAVVIHLYMLTYTWTECPNPVYVLLQKPGQLIDVYNITAILSLLKNRYNDPLIGAKVAITLCIGGNDFIPKLYRQSHEKYLKLMLADEFRNSLFVDDNGRLKLDPQRFVEYIKVLYYGRGKDPNKVTYENVRSASMEANKRKKVDLFQEMFGVMVRDLRMWMPPKSAVLRLADLINLQVEYLNLAGHHDRIMSDICASSCFSVNDDGDVEYDFGMDSHISSLQSVICTNPKRKGEETPQKGNRRKGGTLRKLHQHQRKSESVECY